MFEPSKESDGAETSLSSVNLQMEIRTP
ncbi:hypothetical protein PENANT_c068G02939 [Penicillium antarcticum]|uniref:Uncharacterized protein n=1 Tax=Penicillium antarcticum TaxID=416450 RepID=A0A1V6PPQ0_9EURO|nr:hypothetical protein PENANT_c068G02939 [Penicillium antarcticum]